MDRLDVSGLEADGDPEAQSGGAWELAYPRALRDREQALLRRRRKGAGVAGDDPAVGLALSGGGIRSATFALGVLQGLARRRHLGAIDYLSTVSGGGYIGAFLGRLYTREQVTDIDDVRAVLECDEVVDAASRGSGVAGKAAAAGEGRFAAGQVFRWLRENGRHLAPNGSGDLVLGGAVILRNFLALQIVMLVLVTLLFLVLQGPRLAAELGMPGSWAAIDSALALLPLGPAGILWWSPWVLLALGWLILAVIPLGWSYWVLAGDFTGGPEGPSGLGHNLRPLWGLLLVLAVFLVAGIWAALPVVRVNPGVALFCLAVSVIAAATVMLQAIVRRRAWTGYRPERQQLPRETPDGPLWLARLPAGSEHQARREVSDWLRNGLIVFAVVLGVAVIDTFGQTLYRVVAEGQLLAWLGMLIGALAMAGAAGRRLALLFGGTPGGERPSLPMGVAAALAAAALYLSVLTLVSALAHGVAWGFGDPGVAQRSPMLLIGAVFVALLLSWLFGGTWSFLNRSTLHAMYTARLARAYLGASNPRRVPTVNGKPQVEARGGDVTHPLPDDDLSLDAYFDRNDTVRSTSPWDKGAPLHLINVTVNETVDGRSNIQQNDRKGMGLAVGPAGISTGVRHHVYIGPDGLVKNAYPLALDGGFRVFESARPSVRYPGEDLSLGAWVGISGAAFSTGLGSRTNLAMSLLAGFFNLRLGYWWDSGMPPEKRSDPLAVAGGNEVSEAGAQPAGTAARHRLTRAFESLFPVQSYLVDEFLARFRGVARRWWYLSDGGHFENLGGYELIRRRLPLILIVDAEADPDYGFQGLANLVRKARLDFGAEVHFLDDHEIAQTTLPDQVKTQLGSLEMLRRGPWQDEPVPDSTGRSRRRRVFGPPQRAGRSLACAALARVRYDHDPERVSWLLYLKPALVGDEPADVQHYQSHHPDFPHETTADQFFDEAQWESYRRLGLHIAEKICGPERDGLTRFVDPLSDEQPTPEKA
ncbi:patatin-like phospholipase domain-containing protein [Thioalkalivibrio paradoxus]|uniref:PNPLA domain-containing protein n=1 Tax=Thioalkalivibrio paradoxus ARh 1 TaxID=713585 RepID=W0DRW3_9GAMM|nr:hypothetical protein [Thioalkalivibrio paradoxus]AHF00018.1 hypothetical protein THITH_06560 [Thioalkalivibrio paradoxus ARh 1]